MRILRTIAIVALFLTMTGNEALAGEKMDLSILPGFSMPMGGLWGKYFTGAPALAVSAVKRMSKDYSVGLQAGYAAPYNVSADHKADIGDQSFKLAHLSPFVRESVVKDKLEIYGDLGAGIYYWSMSGDWGDLSGMRYGINVGWGMIYDMGSTRLGLGAKYHSAFNMLDLGKGRQDGNSINFYLSLTY